MFVKATNGQPNQFPYSVGQLRRDNPQTSFPKRIPDEMLAEWGVHQVNPVPAPSHDGRTQWLEQNAQPHLEQGQWFLGWTVKDKAVEQVQEYDDNISFGIRSQRNALLSESDWTQVSDAPVDATAWATYRQALRDITAQEGFPHDISWPEKP